MDTDDEVAERRGRPATRRRHREDDEDDDEEDSSRSNPPRHAVGEDLSHRIVELRTPAAESDDVRPSTSGKWNLLFPSMLIGLQISDSIILTPSSLN